MMLLGGCSGSLDDMIYFRFFHDTTKNNSASQRQKTLKENSGQF